jgi:hypothetical protein
LTRHSARSTLRLGSRQFRGESVKVTQVRLENRHLACDFVRKLR